MNDNDYLFFTTEKHRYPYGDPTQERTVRIVILRRWTFILTLVRPIKKLDA